MGEQLYRLYNEDDQLLYIGISYSAIKRFAEHKDDKLWAKDVARIAIEQLGEITRPEAESIERDAIRSERPKHNKVHNGTCNNRRVKPVYAWLCDWCGGPIIGSTGNVVLDRGMSWHVLHKKCDPIPQWASRYWFEVNRLVDDADALDWTRHLSEKNFWPDAWTGWQALLDRGIITAQAGYATDGEGGRRRARLDNEWRKLWFLDRNLGQFGTIRKLFSDWELTMYSWTTGEENGTRRIPQGSQEAVSLEFFEDEEQWLDASQEMARSYFRRRYQGAE